MRGTMDMHFCASDSPIIRCTKCGERLIMPERSEYVDERRVRHVWKCEPCGYTFEATICCLTARRPFAA